MFLASKTSFWHWGDMKVMGASIRVCVSLFKLGMLLCCSSKCPFYIALDLCWLMLNFRLRINLTLYVMVVNKSKILMVGFI